MIDREPAAASNGIRGRVSITGSWLSSFKIIGPLPESNQAGETPSHFEYIKSISYVFLASHELRPCADKPNRLAN